MTDFPILDHDRATANAEYNRVVFDVFPPLEPHLAEVDDWITLPLRLVHDQAGGWQIEAGIYTFDAADIHTLRRAIAAYDKAVGRTTAQRLAEQ